MYECDLHFISTIFDVSNLSHGVHYFMRTLVEKPNLKWTTALTEVSPKDFTLHVCNMHFDTVEFRCRELCCICFYPHWTDFLESEAVLAYVV